MARDLESALLGALNDDVLRPVLLVSVDTPSGVYRFASGQGSLYWPESPAVEWLGTGNLGGISVINETRDVRAEGISLRLSGIPDEMLTLVLEDAQPGRDVNVYIGMLTSAGALVSDPYLAFAGLLDAVTQVEGGETSAIEIAVESELVRLQKANETRYTHDDQQRRFPGDLGFEYVEDLQDFNIQFGPQGQNVPIGQRLVSRR